MSCNFVNSAVRILVFAFLSVASLAHAGIEIYQDDNFGGRRHDARDEVANLGAVGLNDRVSSAIVDGERWEVCVDSEFRGRCVTLDPGRYPSLRSMGLNDQISSLRPQRRGDHGNPHGRDAVVFYRDDRFSGESFATSRNESDFQYSGFNDRASSIIVNYGQWEVCTDAGFRGRCELLGPGRYSSLRPLGMNDSISSVRRRGHGSNSYRGREDWNGNRSYSDAPPQVFIGRNGIGEVSFSGGTDRCVVYYKDGRRTSYRPSCTGAQIERADDALARYGQR